MRYLTTMLFLFAFLLGSIYAYSPSQTAKEYNSIWLQDEEGLNIAPRITLEPKP